MSETITLPAVKRIEGHGRVSLFLGDDGLVNDAHFDVIEFRGFEKMLEGRMVWEMPLITSRVCGVCPVSHHLAAVKAVDALYGVEIPRAAKLLRELMHLGGFSQDHALHFFFLAGPDFLTGDGTGSRDLLGVIGARPDLARKAIGLRRAGQRIVEIVGGRTSHPVTAIPGGMSKGISAEEHEELRGLARGMLDDALAAVEVSREATLRLLAEHPGYSSDPWPYLAQLDGERFALYDGIIRVLGTEGRITDQFPAAEYADHISERTLQGSYANSPYLTKLGPENGSYRVGPLARLNMVNYLSGPKSDALLADFRTTLGHPSYPVLAYHWARMIELVASVERMIELLDDPDIASADVRVPVERGVSGTGSAAIEAPRGTLIHSYEADAVGRVVKANLIVATTHNVASLDRAVLQAVSGVDRDDALSEDTVRLMELGIRAHDPCLSCATHEIGRMPLVVELVGPDGTVIAERGAV
jgi:coenzyme F420-reducing hydrogenase alpha subunit